MTIGIKTSSKRKMEIYITNRKSNNSLTKNQYKSYCKILADIIKKAKRFCYDNQISNSSNKIKTTWNIVKLVHEGIPVMQQFKL
jgi:hypothetical protein